MKIRKHHVYLLVFILLLSITSSIMAKPDDSLTLEGVVTFNDLEGGFYQVSGYRLSGNMDFSKYLNKYVSVTGTEDESPGIFMTKAIIAEKIEVLDSDQMKKMLTEKLTGISDDTERISILEQIIKLDPENEQVFESLGEILAKYSDDISIYINGERQKYVQTVLPFIEDGRTLAPYCVIEDNTDLSISWDAKNSTLTISDGQKELKMSINDKTVFIDNEPIQIDVPAKIVENRLVIPLRFVAETFGGKVSWFDVGNMVTVIFPKGKELPTLNTLSDFGFSYNGSRIHLGDWDYRVNVTEILGEPQQLNKRLIDEIWYKTLRYDGIMINLRSPKGNGTSFYVDNIVITGSSYVSSRGICTGDSYEKILASYNYSHEGNFDELNHIYTFSDLSVSFISFEVSEGIVKKIDIKIG